MPEVKEYTRAEPLVDTFPSGGSRESPITPPVPLADDLIITSVDVYVEITCGNIGQLIVELRHPNYNLADLTTWDRLHNQTGTGGTLYQWYNDRATFNGKHTYDITGTWVLYVQDTGSGSAGTIQSWKLRVHGTTPKTVTLEYTNGTDVPITNGGNYFSSITVPTADDLIITSLDVYLGIEHGDITELTVNVIHPDTTVSGALDLGTGPNVYKWCEDIGFEGKHSEGTWRLRVFDNGGLATGYIDYWILEIEGTPRPVVVASAIVGEEPVIAWAANVSAVGFDIQLIEQEFGNPVANAQVQWIAVAVEGSVGVLDPDSRLAIQTEHLERHNAFWVDFPIHFDPGITAVVNNAYSGSTFEPYITCPRSVGPARFISGFIDHTGGSPDRAWLQTIAVGEGAPDTNLLIQAGSSAYSATTYSDGDFIFFPDSFAGIPVVVANAEVGGVPVIASARGNATSGFFISLWDFNGNPVFNAEVQWIAVGPRP